MIEDIMTDERVARMHPRQAAILIEVAPEDRRAVWGHAMFRQNISGGTLSENLQLAVQALRSAGSAKALREQDSEDAQRLNRLSNR